MENMLITEIPGQMQIMKSQIELLHGQIEELIIERMGPTVPADDDSLFIQQIKNAIDEVFHGQCVNSDVLIYKILDTIHRSHPLQKWYRPTKSHTPSEIFAEIESKVSCDLIPTRQGGSTCRNTRAYQPMPKWACEIITDKLAYTPSAPMMQDAIEYVSDHRISFEYEHFGKWFGSNGYNDNTPWEHDFILYRVLLTTICNRIIGHMVSVNKMIENQHDRHGINTTLSDISPYWSELPYNWSDGKLQIGSTTELLFTVTNTHDMFNKCNILNAHKYICKIKPILERINTALLKKKEIIDAWCMDPEHVSDHDISNIGLDLDVIQRRYTFF